MKKTESTRLLKYQKHDSIRCPKFEKRETKHVKIIAEENEDNPYGLKQDQKHRRVKNETVFVLRKQKTTYIPTSASPNSRTQSLLSSSSSSRKSSSSYFSKQIANYSMSKQDLKFFAFIKMPMHYIKKTQKKYNIYKVRLQDSPDIHRNKNRQDFQLAILEDCKRSITNQFHNLLGNDQKQFQEINGTFIELKDKLRGCYFNECFYQAVLIHAQILYHLGFYQQSLKVLFEIKYKLILTNNARNFPIKMKVLKLKAFNCLFLKMFKQALNTIVVLLWIAWHSGEENKEVLCYDLLGMLNFYQGNLGKAGILHNRMMMGEVETTKSFLKPIGILQLKLYLSRKEARRVALHLDQNEESSDEEVQQFLGSVESLSQVKSHQNLLKKEEPRSEIILSHQSCLKNLNNYRWLMSVRREAISFQIEQNVKDLMKYKLYKLKLKVEILSDQLQQQGQ